MKKIIAVMLMASMLLAACEKKTNVTDNISIADRTPPAGSSDVSESSASSSESETVYISDEDYKAAAEVLEKFCNAMMIEKNAADVLKYSNVNMLHLVSNTEPVSDEELLKTMEANISGAAETAGYDISAFEVLDGEPVDTARIEVAQGFIKKYDKEKRFSLGLSIKFNMTVTTSEGEIAQEMYVSQINGEWKTDMAVIPYVNFVPQDETEAQTGEAQTEGQS